jgi:ADP-glucose pyrophosphorylase
MHGLEPRIKLPHLPIGELRVQANDIEESLNQHIQTNQAWQRHIGERIHTMEQRQLQQQEEQRAYFHWRGYNLDQ